MDELKTTSNLKGIKDSLRDQQKLFNEENLTLRRPKQHGPQAPDVPDLAQTAKRGQISSKFSRMLSQI